MNVDRIKDWFTLIVAIVTCVAGIIFWVQNTSDDRIARVESDISSLRQDIKEIEADSREILRIVGRLEGLIDK